MRRAPTEPIYGYTSAANPVTFTAAPGETFQVDTVVACGRRFDTHTGQWQSSAESVTNGSAGCIAIEGAQPGQVAVVHILDIQLHEYGYTRMGWPSCVLPWLAMEQGWREAERVVRIRDGLIEWSERVKIPVAPMIGCVGLAMPHEVLSTAHNGRFGGNLDAQEVTIGTRVMLPVEVPGGLLQVGDVHAIQGDGEIDGAGGIETAALLTLKVELRERPKRFRFPRIEHERWIATVGLARPAEVAFAIALEDMIHWMVDEHGFTPPDAHMLLAQVLHARCTQFVDPLYTYLCKVERQYLLA